MRRRKQNERMRRGGLKLPLLVVAFELLLIWATREILSMEKLNYLHHSLQAPRLRGSTILIWKTLSTVFHSGLAFYRVGVSITKQIEFITVVC